MRKKSTDEDDPVVARVRAAREALAKDYDYDIEKLGRAIMKLQAKSKRRYWTPKKRAARA